MAVLRTILAMILMVLAGSACLAPEVTAAAKNPLEDMSTGVAKLASQAKFAEALAAADAFAAAAKAKSGEGDVYFARAIAWRAYLLQVLGRLTEAEPEFKRSLSIYEKALPAGHPDIATAINNLGFQYQITDRLAEAEEHYKRALDMREKALPADSPFIADSLNNIAQVYKHQGRVEEAIPLLRRSLEIRLKKLKPSNPLLAQSLANLGAAYERAGWFNEAEPYLRKALELRKATQGNDHPDTAGIMSKLAQNLTRQKRYDEADALFSEALTMRRRTQPADHVDIANTLHDQAQNLMEMGRLAEAEPLLTEALQIRRQSLPPSHPNAAHTLADLASVAVGENRTEDALNYIREGIAMVLGRGRVDHIGRQRFAEFVRIAWRAFKDRKERKVPVENLLDEAMQKAQSAAFTQTDTAVTRMAARFAATDSDLHAIMRERDEAEAEIARLERELSGVLTLPKPKRGARVEDIRGRVSDLSAEIVKIDERLRNQFPKYFSLVKPEPLDVDEVKTLLGPDEALLSYFATGEETFVWAITRDSAEWVLIDETPAALAQRIAALRSALDVDTLVAQGAGARLFDLGEAHGLYKTLLGPVEAILAGKPSLIVIANGALTGLPFQMMVRSEPKVARPGLNQLAEYATADWLINHHAISVLPSVASLQSIRTVAGAPKSKEVLIGFANPILTAATSAKPASAPSSQPAKVTRGGFSSFWRGPAANLDAIRKGLPPLPETETELKHVAERLEVPNAPLKLGSEATERAVKMANLENYRIVYFATHGLVAGEVQDLGEPALVFTLPERSSDIDDGLLTSSEVSQLKLDADWVVLSACNTAAGQSPGAEALSGLARSFFHAGTRALLVSHWKVGSEAAARLTTGTFDALKDDPKIGRSEALRRSMLKLIADRADPWNAYPTFWAPFAMVGDGRK